MSVLNKLSKVAFYILLCFYIVLQSYGIALFFGGFLFSVVLSVWSIIKPLPYLVTDKLWLVYLLSCIPIGVVIFISMIITLIKSRKNSEQDKK